MTTFSYFPESVAALRVRSIRSNGSGINLFFAASFATLFAEDGHVEGLLGEPTGLRYAIEGAAQRGGGAGFDGNDEGQIAFLVAGALEEGVDVDLFRGEGAGNFGDNAGAIFHDEADVVAQLELSAEKSGAAGQIGSAGSV